MNGEPHRTAVVIQARMTSSRLPEKVLLPLAGQPLIRRVVDRAKCIPGVDVVCVAIPEGPEHEAIADCLSDCDVAIARGPEADVLARTARAVRETQATTVVRITSDCPFIDPWISGSVLSAYRAASTSGIRYVRTHFTTGFPLGFDTEVFAASALFEAETEATDPYEREHVTPFIWRQPDRYMAMLIDSAPDRRHWRLVVDTERDYQLATQIYDRLLHSNAQFGYSDIVGLLSREPELSMLNSDEKHNQYIGLPNQH